MKKNQIKYTVDFINECQILKDDRAIAILIGAELDEFLLKILNKRLLPKSPKSSLDLLSSNGSLGSFASRIELCYRLAIIDDEVRNDLHVIREIRNTFAHDIRGLSFCSKKINDKIKKFRLAKYTQELNLSCSFEINMNEPKNAFCSTGHFLFGHLSFLHERIRRIKKRH